MNEGVGKTFDDIDGGFKLENLCALGFEVVYDMS